MITIDKTTATTLADLLDRDEVFDFLVAAISDARDKDVRPRDENGESTDRDSGDVIDDVINTLRGVR